MSAQYQPDASAYLASSSDVHDVLVDFTDPKIGLAPVGALVASQAGHVRVTAVDPEGQTDAGTAVQVFDGNGSLLGSGAWGAPSRVGGFWTSTADVTVTPRHGGSAGWYVSFSHDGGYIATSDVLPVTVDGFGAPITLTTTSTAVLGRPVGLRVAIGRLPAGLSATTMPVQLYANGVPVGSPVAMDETWGGNPAAHVHHRPGHPLRRAVLGVHDR